MKDRSPLTIRTCSGYTVPGGSHSPVETHKDNTTARKHAHTHTHTHTHTPALTPMAAAEVTATTMTEAAFLPRSGSLGRWCGQHVWSRRWISSSTHTHRCTFIPKHWERQSIDFHDYTASTARVSYIRTHKQTKTQHSHSHQHSAAPLIAGLTR